MTQFVEKKCPICGVVYGLEVGFDDYRQRGGMIGDEKAWWCCPNGHQLVYSESEADRLRRERDRLKQERARLKQQVTAAERSASAYRGQVTRLKNKAKAGECPCCAAPFDNLKLHMAQAHPGFDPEADDMAAAE